jgi:PKD repeat protein
VTINALPFVILTSSSTINSGCRGEVVTLFASPSTAQYTYLWAGQGTDDGKIFSPVNFSPNATIPVVDYNVQYEIMQADLLVINKLTGCQGGGFIGISMKPSPSAGFTYTNVCMPDSALFLDTSYTGSSIPACLGGANYIKNWAYTFSDPATGSKDTVALNNNSNDPCLAMGPVYHNYSAAGNYLAQLVVMNNEGCYDTARANIIVTNINPAFSITPATAAVCLGDSVSFTNSSLSLLSYKWDFGEGPTSTSMMANPKYKYTVANTIANPSYTVKLVASANGCSDSTTQNVTVYPIPDAAITASSFSSCIGTNDTLSISSLYDSPAYSVVWENQSTGTVIANDTSMVIVTSTGRYKVTVTDLASLCDDADSISINYISPPTGLTIVAPASGCSNAPIKLIGKVSGDSLSLLWTTTNGNGTFSAAANDTTFYTSDPLDPASLTFIFSAYNRCDTLTSSPLSIALLAAPTGSFTFTPAEPFENDLLTFVNMTDSTGGKVSKWDWTFDDGTTSTLWNPTHTFQKAGKHLITLNLVSNAGCKGTVSDSVYVSGPRIFIPNVFMPTANNPENAACKVYGVGVSSLEFSFTIYNKWGTVVYQTTDFSTANTVGWNGHNLNGGDQLPMGVYTYAVKGRFFDGDIFEKTGTVTLVR